MYLKHWQLNEFPFDNVWNARFYFETESYRLLCEDLYDAIVRRRGAIVLTGDTGCGKTTTIQRVLLDLPEERFDIALIANACLSPVEMLFEINQQLGLKKQEYDKELLLRAIRDHLSLNANKNKDTVICIDGAQSISDADTLEELKLLLNFQFNNRFLVTLILVGRPEMQKQVNAVKQLNEQITLNLHIGTLSLEEAMNYTLHRLKVAGCKQPILTKHAMKLIYQHSSGIPRLINNLADRCLLVGMRLSASVIDQHLVEETLQRYPD